MTRKLWRMPVIKSEEPARTKLQTMSSVWNELKSSTVRARCLWNVRVHRVGNTRSHKVGSNEEAQDYCKYEAFDEPVNQTSVRTRCVLSEQSVFVRNFLLRSIFSVEVGQPPRSSSRLYALKRTHNRFPAIV